MRHLCACINIQKPATDTCCWSRYLLLEDADTGDVLMPLTYLRAFFDANYSRKLSSLKHRIVSADSRWEQRQHQGQCFCFAAQEGPKSLVSAQPCGGAGDQAQSVLAVGI